jgi:hypothetical protein
VLCKGKYSRKVQTVPAKSAINGGSEWIIVECGRRVCMQTHIEDRALLQEAEVKPIRTFSFIIFKIIWSNTKCQTQYNRGIQNMHLEHIFEAVNAWWKCMAEGRGTRGVLRVETLESFSRKIGFSEEDLLCLPTYPLNPDVKDELGNQNKERHRSYTLFSVKKTCTEHPTICSFIQIYRVSFHCICMVQHLS